MTEPSKQAAPLPCPFCTDIDAMTYDGQTICTCGAKGPRAQTDAEAIAAWNTRPKQSDAVREAVEACAKIADEADDLTQWGIAAAIRAQLKEPTHD